MKHVTFSLSASVSLLFLIAFLVLSGCPNPTTTDPDQVALDMSPNGGVYSETQVVTITATPSDATIMYTLDGTDPTRTHGYEYTHGSTGFAATESRTVKALGFKDGWSDSGVVSERYTILWWVAATAEGGIYFSMDGGDYWWHQDVSGIASFSGLVTDGANQWLGYKATPPTEVSTTVYSSTDRGATFSSTVLSANRGALDVVCDHGGVWMGAFYEYGGSGSTYYLQYSTDIGATWQTPLWHDPTYPASISDLTAVASDHVDTWVAVGQSATAVYSTGWHDGPWYVGSGLSGNMFAVATNQIGDWVAVGATTGLSGGGIDGLAYYSVDDGATWSASSLPSDIPQLWDVAAAPGTNRFVAIGGATEDVPVILYSTDGGQSFASATHPLSSTEDDLNKVCYDGYGTWIAVGGNRTIVGSSSGGASWTRESVAAASTSGASTDTLVSVSFGRWEH